MQSPIDIVSATAQAGPPLEFDYQDNTLTVTNTGHVIEVPYAAGSELRVGNDIYELESIQFHTRSEHTYLGQQFDMEAHLVHRNVLSGELAIVAVFLRGGASQNGFVFPAIDNAPETVSSATTSLTVNARDLLPASGALTTTSADAPVEYTPVVYSPFADGAMAYTPVGYWDKDWKETWKANWAKWKEALRSAMLIEDKEERKAAKEAAKEERKAAKEAAKQERREAREARHEERRDGRQARREERHDDQEARDDERHAERHARQDERHEDRHGRRDERREDRDQPPPEDQPPPDPDPVPDPDPLPDPDPPADTFVTVDTYFEYMGSLTMPTCDEGVRWLVLPAVIDISSASVAEMQRLVGLFPHYDGYPFNNRPLQPVFMQRILQIEPAVP
jgi:carbonic anhydrase